MSSISEFFKSQYGGILIKCVLLLIVFLVGLLLPSPLSQEDEEQIALGTEELADTIDMQIENGVYTGSIIKGTQIRHGYGKFKLNNGTEYEGEWKEDALPYGIKVTKYSVYTGRFDENLKNHGFGIIIYNERYIKEKSEQHVPDGDIFIKYIGNWVSDNKTGLGRAIMNNGDLRFGMYSEGILQPMEGAQYKMGDRVYGIDASHYQQNIDWDQLAIYCDEKGRSTSSVGTYMQPVLFVYLKATEGATVKDDRYNIRMIEAEKHGIVQGPYHVLHLTTSSIKDQLKNFFATAIWTPGDLPPALDIEFENEIVSCGVETFYEMTLKWLKAVEKKMGVKPVIYTNESIRNKYLQDERLKGYDIWISKYSGSPQDPDWQFWQLTEKGLIKGHEGNIDINIYNGDYTSFMEYLNR